jgi:hypothetical protein
VIAAQSRRTRRSQPIEQQFTHVERPKVKNPQRQPGWARAARELLVMSPSVMRVEPELPEDPQGPVTTTVTRRIKFHSWVSANA